MKFVFSGLVRIGKNLEKFEREIEAGSEGEARERLYSLFGSEHRAKRRWIRIDSVKKLVEKNG